jgi:NADH-quinone oxidoreductase subunit N
MMKRCSTTLLILKLKEFYSIIAIISVIIGSVALGAQYKIKRFLAYSAISHIGFILISYITISPIAYCNYLIIYI